MEYSCAAKGIIKNSGKEISRASQIVQPFAMSEAYGVYAVYRVYPQKYRRKDKVDTETSYDHLEKNLIGQKIFRSSRSCSYLSLRCLPRFYRLGKVL